jgi:gluconokinase
MPRARPSIERLIMIIVIMGVSGVGKTTVGELLSQQTGWAFYDADSFHSPANIEKMRSGVPLTDEDRWPWLDRLNAVLRDAERKGESVILACSALKQRYRDRIAQGVTTVRWVHLAGAFELIKQRIDARKGHYMTAKLLESQFAALERPLDALEIDVSADPEQLAANVSSALALPHR